MKQYTSDKIKNVAVLGHGGSGKTTLTEALLYITNTSDRFGTIADGNTVSDYDPEEIKRKASIGLSILPIEQGDSKINFIDAPGLFDFTTDMYSAGFAADSILIAVSGKSGVTVGTKKAYKLAKKLNKPAVFFVSKLDRESADFYKVLEQMKASFGPSVCPITVPYGDKTPDGYVNLLTMKAYKYENGKPTEVELPQSEHRLEGLKTAISEAVAETDEALFEKYFSGEQFTEDEIVKGVHDGVKSGAISPVFCGSATELQGLDLLLKYITRLLPSTVETETLNALSQDGSEAQIKTGGTELVAQVFKTVADPFIGKISYIKVLSGVLKSGMEVKNASTGESEKIGKLYYMCGKKQIDAGNVVSGDIAVASKLSANTGDTICTGNIVKLPISKFDTPCYSMAIVPKAKGDESKISQGISKLLEEDKSLSFAINHETHQQIISGLGEQHLDVVVAKLSSKFGVEVSLEPPVVAYRETITKKVKVQGRHKKQSGGHGQFGDVWIEFEPCDSADMLFEQKVVGGAVPKNYFPAVEKGLRECIAHGVLAGYPVVGLKATLTDGSYHPVDSSEMSFKMAAAVAYKAGMAEASPILLEPIGHLSVTTPDANTGDMMGELNKRRGRVLGMSPADDGNSVIEAEVPMSEMHDFATLVRQMTQGSGSFEYSFERYEQLPNQLVAGVIEKAQKLFAEE